MFYKKLVSFSFLVFVAGLSIAQVTNEVQVYVKPGTEVHVFQNFVNTNTGSVNVDEEGLLYVSGTLTNNGTMAFQNDASLLRGSTGVDGGSGTFTVRREGGATGNQFSMWSAPVTNHPSISGTTYRYDETASTQSPTDDQPSDPGWSSYGGAMVPGEGFAVMGAGTVTFSGSQVNNGNVNINLNVAPYNPTSLAPGTPFNLVGNPFPSGLDLAELVNDNPNVFGSIYLWSDDGSGGTDYAAADYSVWNQTGSLPYVNGGVNGDPAPNGIVKTGQAFMLRNNSAGSLQFNNSQRVANTASNAFYRLSAEDSRLWFSINGPDESYFNQILIGLLEDATNEEDRLYDAVKLMGSTGTSLAAQAHGNDYAILAFPPPYYSETIPLTVNVESEQNYVFRADRMEGFEGMNVYFNDSQTGQSVLLEEGTEITVQIPQNTYVDRFYLNFTADQITGISEVEDGLRSWVFQNTLVLDVRGSDLSNVGVDMFDINGRLVNSKQIGSVSVGQSMYQLPSLSSGVYLVRISHANGTITQKALID